MISPESQELLEEIFAEWGNSEEAQKDPETCLQALLAVIAEKVSLPRSYPPLRGTLWEICPPGYAANFVRRRREAKEQAKS